MFDFKKYSKKLKLKDIPIRPHGKFIKVPVLTKENSQSIRQERYGRGKPLLKIHVGDARRGLQGHRIKTIRCSQKLAFDVSSQMSTHDFASTGRYQCTGGQRRVHLRMLAVKDTV
uniref:Uncharacterized protein n=1 Tax=Micrurus surinamensis TaxID=129470 RepID=A0A2D4PUL4_MICSU